jgi:hypothetical protein
LRTFDTDGEVIFAMASTLTHQDFQPSTKHEPRVFPTSPAVSFECDQNLWDAVGESLGRTPGVESHRTLDDYRESHPPIRHRRTAMTSNPESIVQQLHHAFPNLLAYVSGPEARSPTAYRVELTLFRRRLALGAAL